jgi:hypothetical protein
MTEPTNDEIRLAIAKAKHWGFVQINKNPDRFWCYHFSIGSVGATEVDALDTESKITDEKTSWPVDMASAWELEQEIKNDGLAVTLIDHAYKCKVIVRYEKGGEYNAMVKSEADTAPRAVCLAWLKWKGITLP